MIGPVNWLARVLLRRPPDVMIGGTADPYMLRWWVIPRNRFLNIYLHEFRRSDDDRALHDHPWHNVSLLLRGSYDEHLPGGVAKRRTAPAVVFRRPESAHRIALVPGTGWPVTLFITGPWRRTWGFYCPQGWIPWQRFTAEYNDKTGRSRGCDWGPE